LNPTPDSTLQAWIEDSGATPRVKLPGMILLFREQKARQKR
jgi:hypothetical protein